MLAAYRPRYAEVAALAGFGNEFAATGDFDVVEEIEGIGMTDYYGLSGKPATPEKEPMSESEFDRKVALLQASWRTFDDAAAAYRDAFVEGILDHHVRGEPARSWELQFLIRRCAWHMLDHAWELQDREVTTASA